MRIYELDYTFLRIYIPRCILKSIHDLVWQKLLTVSQCLISLLFSNNFLLFIKSQQNTHLFIYSVQLTHFCFPSTFFSSFPVPWHKNKCRAVLGTKFYSKNVDKTSVIRNKTEGTLLMQQEVEPLIYSGIFVYF